MLPILQTLIDKKIAGKKAIAVLIDPDKVDEINALQKLINLASENYIDFFFIGGSLVTTNNLNQIIRFIKDNCNIPVILFPGSNIQIDLSADALLFLSLISGRNPELLIGQHVTAAPLIKNSKLEVLPTGYMLINSGKLSSAAYMSNTTPIPEDKYTLAACTALAGEMLGLKLIYLDAGSGAEKPISQKMISTVKRTINVPLIVGGGINSTHKAKEALFAGADVLVIGNALEKEPDLLTEISESVYTWNKSAQV
ncbi:MAG TPA: geranylgeranylglyceryl/heptaprenylglyceryl phosphate synthase [Cyclobacteriaceae bacterium]|nr:geranylgeranylglyceryl/heptaprenylglyceryl phosphate synthase [Cyclobacteriaceae bacterium]